MLALRETHRLRAPVRTPRSLRARPPTPEVEETRPRRRSRQLRRQPLRLQPPTRERQRRTDRHRNTLRSLVNGSEAPSRSDLIPTPRRRSERSPRQPDRKDTTPRVGGSRSRSGSPTSPPRWLSKSLPPSFIRTRNVVTCGGGFGSVEQAPRVAGQ